MNTISISRKAHNKIQHILDEINYSDPVAVLVDVADPGKSSAGIKMAFLKGDGKDKLREMAREMLEQVEGKLKFKLRVVAYEKKDVQIESLIDISGITFSMNIKEYEALRDSRLAITDEGFVLEGPDGIAHSLQAAIMKR